MKRSICFLFFALMLSLQVNAQSKVYYFDKDGKTVDSKADCEHYQVVTLQEDGITQVKSYYADDQLSYEEQYSFFEQNGKENIKEGLQKYYAKTDAYLWHTATYRTGKLHGELRSYYPGGELKRIEHYNDGLFVNGECFETDGSPRKFTHFHQMPEFPGGEKAMMGYLSENLKYPKKARKKGVQGKAIISFVVNKDGSVGDVNILQNPGEGCGEEAARLVSKMPKWNPGAVDDRPVKVRYSLPLTFRLD